MVLVSNASTTYLYEFPEPIYSVTESHVHITPIKHLATDKEEGDVSRRKIWESLCRHHEGRISVLRFRNYYRPGLELVMFPPAKSGAGASVYNDIRYDYTIGSTRVLWSEEMENLRFFSRVHTTKHDDHVGYRRLGRKSAHDTTDETMIISSLSNHYGVDDLSWDEESGRICVITDEYEGDETNLKWLTVIDLI